MSGPTRSDTYDADMTLVDGAGDPGVGYLEAIALLQGEVARLEQELRWRDEKASDAEGHGTAPNVEPDNGVAEAAGARAEVERLALELAGRDETIGLLLDQLSRVEEATAAGRAEWEHVAGWLAELERRVEGQDEDAMRRLDEQLAAREREVQDLRKRAEQERRAGEAEMARLRAAVTRSQGDAAARDDEAGDSLRSENHRLRAALEESERQLDARLAETLRERDDLRGRLERVEDERRRERHEHTAALVELQAQLSRASLARPDETSLPATSPTNAAHDRDVDLRIRALREHLLEIHHREEEARKQKQLLPRLSRLWSRTGPR